MTTAITPDVQPARLPTHKDLPITDGAVPTSYHEHPQSSTLTGTLLPVVRRRRPDGRFSIGSDSFIYWRAANPATKGAKAPTGSSCWAWTPCSTARCAAPTSCGRK